jgi:formimidoylglutamate deiminase
LRQFDFAQRLAHRARYVMAVAGGSTGRALFEGALHGGAQALQADRGAIASGAPADFVTLDAAHPGFAGCAEDRILDAWIFASASPAVDCVWVRGRKWVEGGRHRARERILSRFRAAMDEMREA